MLATVSTVSALGVFDRSTPPWGCRRHYLDRNFTSLRSFCRKEHCGDMLSRPLVNPKANFEIVLFQLECSPCTQIHGLFAVSYLAPSHSFYSTMCLMGLATLAWRGSQESLPRRLLASKSDIAGV